MLKTKKLLIIGLGDKKNFLMSEMIRFIFFNDPVSGRDGDVLRRNLTNYLTKITFFDYDYTL